MVSFTESEIKIREKELTDVLDAKNLVDLADRRPELVEKINRLLEVGHSPKKVGKVIRKENPQMWVESKFGESVARALIEEQQK